MSSSNLPASLAVETSWSTSSQLECDYCAFTSIKSKERVSLKPDNTLDQIQGVIYSETSVIQWGYYIFKQHYSMHLGLVVTSLQKLHSVAIMSSKTSFELDVTKCLRPL